MKLVQYATVTPEEFWEMVDNGFNPPRYCFLIMADNSQDWGYPMVKSKIFAKIFDHHRQGGSHKQPIKFILICLDPNLQVI